MLVSVNRDIIIKFFYSPELMKELFLRFLSAPSLHILILLYMVFHLDYSSFLISFNEACKSVFCSNYCFAYNTLIRKIR